MIIDLRNINPNVILKRQPSAAIAYLVLFCITAWFVWRFGAIALGSLVILSFFAYLAIKKPFYILLITLATIFFPANFEEAIGVSFRVTPTRIFGILLLLSLVMQFNRFNGQYSIKNRTVAIAFILVLWGAFTDLISYPEFLGNYFVETLPALVVLIAIVLFVKNRADLNKVLLVIMLACMVTAISGLFETHQGRAVGLPGNPNALSYNCMIGLAMTLSFFRRNLHFVKKIFLLLVMVIFLSAFGFAASRSVTLGLLVMVFIILRNYIKKPTNLILFFLMIVLFIYFAPTIFWQRFNYIPMPGHAIYSSVQSETGIRVWMYRRGWELFFESPVWGWGAFSFPKVNGSFMHWSMHSWYLAMLCEQGIIGLALYLAFFIAVYKNIKSAVKESINTRDLSQYLLALTIGLAVSGTFSSGPLDKLVFIMAGISVVLANISSSDRLKDADAAAPTKQ